MSTSPERLSPSRGFVVVLAIVAALPLAALSRAQPPPHRLIPRDEDRAALAALAYAVVLSERVVEADAELRAAFEKSSEAGRIAVTTKMSQHPDAVAAAAREQQAIAERERAFSLSLDLASDAGDARRAAQAALWNVMFARENQAWGVVQCALMTAIDAVHRAGRATEDAIEAMQTSTAVYDDLEMPTDEEGRLVWNEHVQALLEDAGRYEREAAAARERADLAKQGVSDAWALVLGATVASLVPEAHRSAVLTAARESAQVRLYSR